MKKPKIKIIPVPYEATVSGAKGTIKGPSAIIKMLQEQIEDYDKIIKKITLDYIRIEIEKELPVKTLPPEKMVKEVEQKIKQIKDFTIILGGEHSISIGAIKAMREKYQNLTVVQIDAHLDLRDSNEDYTFEHPSKFAHCCVMRRAREYGCKTVHIGIRTMYSGEVKYIEEEEIQDKIFECPIRSSPKEIIKKIETEDVYLTLDIDGIDPCYMPGTGTPVQGGLDWYFVLDLIKEIFEKKNVIGADIVEVSPLPDNHLTEYGAAQILYHMIGFKYHKVLK